MTAYSSWLPGAAWDRGPSFPLAAQSVWKHWASAGPPGASCSGAAWESRLEVDLEIYSSHINFLALILTPSFFPFQRQFQNPGNKCGLMAYKELS